MAYFDTATLAQGFTIRVHYEVELGVVTITNIQLQSQSFGGSWYPGGTIKINDETVFSMDYMNPATHIFTINSAGSTWYDIGTLTGSSLPVSNGVAISGASAEIEVNIELYKSSTGTMPVISAVETVDIISGLIYIGNGSSFDAYEVYIDNGSSWDRYIPYIDNGSSWDMCN